MPIPYRLDGENSMTLLVDDPEFTITAHASPDDDADISWLGQFTGIWSPDAIEINRTRRSEYRYFLPAYTIAQRREELSRRGYAKGVADEYARAHARHDAHLATVLEPWYIRVEVSKAGVTLGSASLSIQHDPARDLSDEMAHLITEYGLIREAITEARTTLAALTAP